MKQLISNVNFQNVKMLPLLQQCNVIQTVWAGRRACRDNARQTLSYWHTGSCGIVDSTMDYAHPTAHCKPTAISAQSSYMKAAPHWVNNFLYCKNATSNKSLVITWCLLAERLHFSRYYLIQKNISWIDMRVTSVDVSDLTWPRNELKVILHQT